MNFGSRVIIQAFRNVLSSKKREIDCRHALNIKLSMLDLFFIGRGQDFG